MCMTDEAKKEFVEPEVTKSEKPLDEVTMQGYDHGMIVID